MIDATCNLSVVELGFLLRHHALLGAELAQVTAIGELHEEIEAIAIAGLRQKVQKELHHVQVLDLLVDEELLRRRKI